MGARPRMDISGFRGSFRVVLDGQAQSCGSRRKKRLATGETTISRMKTLQPDAAAAYDRKVESLPEKLKPAPDPPPSKTGSSDAYVSAQITDEDMEPGSLREYHTDFTGEPQACYFESARGFVGLDDDDHENLRAVTGRLSKESAYRDFLSQKFIYETSIDWLKARADDPAGSPPSFIKYLDEAASKAVKRREIWLPIPVVRISRPFQIGRVIFRRLTKSMLDERITSITASERDKEIYSDRIRRKLQGATAACVSVEAEPIRAEDYATEESTAPIAVLRLVCPAILHIHKWAPLDPSFIGSVRGPTLVRVENGRIVGEHDHLPKGMLTQWVIPPAEIEENLRTVWGAGHNLIVSDRNPFQEMLLGAVIQYSRSILKADIAERLLYVVSALESVLIKDPRESIVQNLRERLALMAGPDPTERRMLAELVSEVYELRSSFVHRALPVLELSRLDEFLLKSGTTMYFLLGNYDKWRTKEDFLKAIDNHKFAGPIFSTAGLPSV
jgi:hypothetical protein